MAQEAAEDAENTALSAGATRSTHDTQVASQRLGGVQVLLTDTRMQRTHVRFFLEILGAHLPRLLGELSGTALGVGFLIRESVL